MKLNKKGKILLVFLAIFIAFFAYLQINNLTWANLIYPTPQGLAAQYNKLIERVGFGYRGIDINGKTYYENQTVNIQRDNTIEPNMEIMIDDFTNITTEIYINDTLINKKNYNFDKIKFDLPGKEEYNNQTLKIVTTGYFKRDRLVFKEDAKFLVFQTNRLVYEK